MKEENIRVLVMEPDKAAEERTVPNTLEALQELVGGRIEVITLTGNMALIVDEEGKFKEKAACMFLFRNGWIDTLVGTVVAVGTDGEEFCGLTDGQITRARNIWMIANVATGG